jgi:3-hydroxy acid dehydrogenase/malonic semialdehyde reductase
MSVFITGASAGIGAATAKAFAALGRDLVLVARREERLKELKAELLKEHGSKLRVDTFELDVTDSAAVDALMKNHQSVLSQVDVLINNAGLALGREPIQQGSPSDWDVMIDTNIKGLLYVTHAFLPQLIAKGAGHIVNMGSVAGYWTYPNGNIYAATKFAVRAITESLRLDLHGSGVRVSEVAPGMVETDFSRVRFKGDEQKAKSIYEGTTPLTPEDIAEAIVWCVQRPAHVNIQEIVIFPTEQASSTMVKRR